MQSPLWQISVPEAPREERRLRRPPLKSRAPLLGRSRAAEAAVRPVGRAGAATSHGGLGAKCPTLTIGAS
eukprot:5250684-Alexandrium_andersonii.AAC.1